MWLCLTVRPLADGAFGERIETGHTISVLNKEVVQENYSNRKYDVNNTTATDLKNATFDIKARTIKGTTRKVDDLDGFMMSYRMHAKKQKLD